MKANPSTMVDSILERRRALEERLRRATEAAQVVDVATFEDGRRTVSVDEFDPEKHLRESARVLHALASRRPSFDVSVYLGPEDAWGFRVRAGEGGHVEVTPLSARVGDVPDTQTSALAAEATQAEEQIAASLADFLRDGPAGAER